MHQNQGLDWTSDIRSEKGLFGILAGEEQPSRTPPTESGPTGYLRLAAIGKKRQR